MKTWIIGCGDIGRRVAALYFQQNNNTVIHGLVRSQESIDICMQVNIKAQQVDLDTQYTFNSVSLKNDFSNADVFYFAPPPSEEKNDPRLNHFLQTIKNHPRRIVLISTTGVYGDSKGEWIDENTPVNPKTDRAHRRLSAEQSLKNWAEKYHKEFMILRVPGIYAQDRLPLARLKKGLPIVNEDEAGWTNRIHADDLAQACKAAMLCTTSNEIINITDGNPSTMTDYFNQVADYAKLPRPPQIPMKEAKATLSAGMVSYLKESRNIKNEKMLELLKVELKYPTLSATLTPE